MKAVIENKSGNYYLAADVYKRLGVNYRGYESKYFGKVSNSNFEYDLVPTKVGNHTQRVNAYIVNETGIKQLCEAAGKNFSTTFPEIAPVNQKNVEKLERKIESMEKVIDDMKVLLAQSLIAPQSARKELSLGTKTAKVINDPLQGEARKRVRKVVEDYAEKRATQLGINDSEKRRIFYDLTYKALYNKYKDLTANQTDLKKLAEEKSKTGTKVSALQVAEQLGVAVELLQLAETLFNS